MSAAEAVACASSCLECVQDPGACGRESFVHDVFAAHVLVFGLKSSSQNLHRKSDMMVRVCYPNAGETVSGLLGLTVLSAWPDETPCLRTKNKNQNITKWNKPKPQTKINGSCRMIPKIDLWSLFPRTHMCMYITHIHIHTCMHTHNHVNAHIHTPWFDHQYHKI